MPKKVGTENWRKKRRQEYLEMKEFRYYIFCEGEQTEPQYFRGFKRLIEDNPIYRDMVLIQIEPCGAETMRIIGQAEKYVKNIRRPCVRSIYDRSGVHPDIVSCIFSVSRVHYGQKDHASHSDHMIGGEQNVAS